jgi:hypothetical protein
MPASLDRINGDNRIESNGIHPKTWLDNGTGSDDVKTCKELQHTVLPSSARFKLSSGSTQSSFASSSSQPVLPADSLHVRQTATAGRGVFASVPLTAGTLLDVSHILLFPAKEYHEHGRHTQLDDYTYIWSKGSEGNTMALALGIGE